jgi:hypothetical protein
MKGAMHLGFKTQEERYLVITDELVKNQAMVFGAQGETRCFA